MKLTEKQLRRIIREAIEEEVNEATMSQARVEGPLKDFVANVRQAQAALGKQGAKKALGALFQQVQDEKASKQAEKLLHAVGQIEKSCDTVLQWLEHMPELTQDPWSHVGKHG